MRPIDADEALELIDDYKKSISMTAKTEVAVSAIEDIVRFICPTIDAEPVVRCKDCKYFLKLNSERMCGKKLTTVNEDYYCSNGTKRNEEQG